MIGELRKAVHEAGKVSRFSGGEVDSFMRICCHVEEAWTRRAVILNCIHKGGCAIGYRPVPASRSLLADNQLQVTNKESTVASFCAWSTARHKQLVVWIALPCTAEKRPKIFPIHRERPRVYE